MSARPLILVAVLVAMFAKFPLLMGFQWIEPKSELTKTKVIHSTSRKVSVTLRWEWRLSVGEETNQVQVKRYRSTINEKDKTIKDIAFLYADDTQSVDKNYFTLDAHKGTAGSRNGYMELIIKDVTDQGNNKDPNDPVNVMTANYTYECSVTVKHTPAEKQPTPRPIELIVLERPSIKTPPQDALVTNRITDLALYCIANGKPTPTITWKISKVFTDSISTWKGEKILISETDEEKKNFVQTSDIGTYNCTATNELGSVSAAAVVQITECGVGCSSDNEIAIEMTGLTYVSDYRNPYSEKYRKLKKDIEIKCLAVYARATQKVYSCVVTGFRSGSVIANVKITYESSINKPRQPLLDAIKTGTFAGYPVRKEFASPTDAPTQSTQPTSPVSGPDADKRTSESLSTGTVTAIVAVLAVVFIIILVALVVYLMKRQKPRAQESRPATIKSSSVPHSLYSDEPDNHYNYRRGPPPQYTPSRHSETNYNRPHYTLEKQRQMGRGKSGKNELWI